MTRQKLSQTIPAEIRKYLLKHGSTDWQIELPEKKLFELIIVIPAISEFANHNILLTSLLKNDKKFFFKTLILFVVNNFKSSLPQIKSDNRESINLFGNIIKNKNDINDDIICAVNSAGLHIGLVDAAAEGKELPEKEGGVGLARKIGMDLALEYFDYNSGSKNILGCLDADCTVSENYLEEIIEKFNNKNFSAAHVNFTHPVSGNDDEKAAIICYEIFLRYYVLALIQVNSPFGFFSIGSTMFCDAESYTKVQGMSKRKAAEDFYFMEKLAKISKIEEIKKATVFPSGRGSWRVPFGTGQRVNRFLKGTHDEHTLYSQKSFSVLGDWLKIFMDKKILIAKEYLMEAKFLNEELYSFLIKNNFEQSWNKILENTQSDKQINKQKINWFDGFRTLKLIHHLRDNCFPNEPMFSVLDEIFSKIDTDFKTKSKLGVLPPLNNQLKYLEHLRELT